MGDEHRLEELYRRLAPLIHRRCRRILRDEQDALDAVQDIFLNLERSLPEFRGEAQITTWIYRITLNHCLNRLRAAENRARAIAALEVVVRTVPRGRLEDEVARRALATTLITALEPRRAQILYLYYCDELSQLEIAAVLGLSDRTIRTELSRGVEELRAASRGLGEEVADGA